MFFRHNQSIPGKAPAIALIEPKYYANVGAVVRAASNFGIDQVWFTGDRLVNNVDRLPRELRLPEFDHVDLIKDYYFVDKFPKGVIPVAIELVSGSESLVDFEHSEQNLYIFGPEDGSIPKSYLRLCHKFVHIPTKSCINLAGAVHVVLYDRLKKMHDITNPPYAIGAHYKYR